jgi:voltage-gated potassium channel
VYGKPYFGAVRKISFLNLLILVLSIYVLAALFIDTVFQLDQETSRLLDMIDFGICLIFLADFSIQLYKAESKLDYMKWGWVDLLASIPMVDAFRVGRLFRLIRILRIFKAFKSLKEFIDTFYADKIKGTVSSAGLVAILMVIFSSISILQVETDSDSNIKSAGDALWWSYVTITTVGYGDLYPVTLEGRLIAVVLMTTGVGLFGTFTAFVASWFVKN